MQRRVRVIANNIRDILAMNNKTDKFTIPQPSEDGAGFVYTTSTGERFFIRVSKAVD